MTVVQLLLMARDIGRFPCLFFALVTKAIKSIKTKALGYHQNPSKLVEVAPQHTADACIFLSYKRPCTVADTAAESLFSFP